MNLEKHKKSAFLVVALAIVYDPLKKRILIGKRKKDPEISSLSWSFPGGSVNNGEDPEHAIERTVKEKTGLVVKSLGSIFARVPKESKNLFLIYYLCEKLKGKEKAGSDFVSLNWIKPKDLRKYVTTSIDPRLKEYLDSLG